MLRLKKKMMNCEQTFSVKAEPDGYYVLIRRSRKWLPDEMGLDLGSVVSGEPSDKDRARIFPSHIAGPFSTHEEAEEYLTEQVAEIKRADPKRFARLAELQKPIMSPREVNNEK